MEPGSMQSPSDPPDIGAMDVGLAERLTTALWIYDFDAERIVWANASARRLWGAADVASLAARDMGREMSNSVRARLAQHREDFDRDPHCEVHELWTLYPDGAPVRVRAVLRRRDLDDGRSAMLVEAHVEQLIEPTTVRSADALMHTRTMTALYAQDGLPLYANPAHRAAFGPGARPFGVDFADQSLVAAFRAGLRARGEHRETALLRTVDGPRWHDLHAVRCRDAVTGDGAFLTSATDVTAQREHERALAEARDAAERADRAKSTFLATMSHELRTPLNGVLGMTAMLAQTGPSVGQAQALSVIRASGLQMLEMIEDMLDVVSLDAGAVELAPAPFDAIRMLEAAAALARPDAERKGLRLVVDARGLGDGRARHDARRIQQALRHLLSNAVKFTQRGGIMLRAFCDAAGAMTVEVADTGPGVPPAHRARIFERFEQGDGSTTRLHGGSGLGLAIVRDLVRLWGGEIGLSDGPAGGSVFWFTVPGAMAVQAAPQTGQSDLRVVSMTRNSAHSAS
jgi:signal transduction histidine kinase